MSDTEEERALIVNVWADNLHREMARLREVVVKYPYIAMDTEFPGVVAKPLGQFRSASDYNYQTLRVNVDLLKIIQLGVTLSDAQGNRPPGVCCWQFNFRFDRGEDVYAKDSIELLVRSGIDFESHRTRGIDAQEFAELLMTSGLVLDDSVTWIAFHCGYDFAYLLKLLMNQSMPETENEFLELVALFFPVYFDVKYIMYCCDNFKGSLKALGQSLQVFRIGAEHQAGSDSLLTAATFFKLQETYLNSTAVLLEMYVNVMYGLGKGCVVGIDTGLQFAISGSGGGASTGGNGTQNNGVHEVNVFS